MRKNRSFLLSGTLYITLKVLSQGRQPRVVSSRVLAKRLGVDYHTAKRYVIDLNKLGFISRFRPGRGFAYQTQVRQSGYLALSRFEQEMFSDA